MILYVLALLCLLIPSAEAQQVKVVNAVVVTKTQDTYTAVFTAMEDADRKSTLAMTQEDYDALAVADSALPNQDELPKGSTWVFTSASKNDEYSTPSGTLEPGSIYLVADKIAVILENGEQIALDSKDYTVTDDATKGVTIVPDPAGFTVKDGEIAKDEAAIGEVIEVNP